MISFRYKDIQSKINPLLYKMLEPKMFNNKVFSIFLRIWPYITKWKQFKHAHISMVGKFLIGLDGTEEVIFSSGYESRKIML